MSGCKHQRIMKYHNKILGPFTRARVSELPRGKDCPVARVTSRSDDDLLSRGNVAPGQVHRNLITTNSFESL